MITKKMVVVLVLIAVILAVVSLSYTVMNPSQKISTNAPANDIASTSGVGKVGVKISPPAVETKNP